MVKADVIVIGAGLAGLKAAHVLVDAGKRVVVLEARDRVGGRMMKGEVSGHIVDCGAQWVGPRHTRLLAEARRFEMETTLQYADGKSILSLNGSRTESAGDVPSLPSIALVEIAMLRRRWQKEVRSLPATAPWSARKVKDWDSQTLETWVMKNLSTRDSRGFARLVPAIFGANASEVSYLWMLEMLRSSDGLEHLMNVKGGVLEARFKGGAHALAQKMADALEGRVMLSAPVLEIAQDETGVVAKTGAAEFSANCIIAALAPALCAAIDFNQLSPTRRMLQHRMPHAPLTKFHVAYNRPFWRDEGYSGQVMTDDLPLGSVMEESVAPPILVAFARGSQALALSGMDVDTRRAAVVGCLATLFGAAAADAMGYVEKDWSADEWSGGHTGTMGPGVLTHYGAALRAPCGRVHWAGSETAAQWPGYMEGALESGERAAGEVLARS